jgi:hypothetical protein
MFISDMFRPAYFSYTAREIVDRLSIFSKLNGTDRSSVQGALPKG